jgi:hypothetical protein
VEFHDELSILNPKIFRKCLGWRDAGGNVHFGSGHEGSFLIPPLEALMPPQVPVRKRCDACVLDLRRYKRGCRIRRFRSSKFHVNKITWWNNVLQMRADGKIRLSEEAVSKIKVEIQINGG